MEYHVTSCCYLGDRARVYGSHSAGCKAGDPGGGPLPAGTCHHVQAGSKVSGIGGEERERRRREGWGGREGGREEGREGRRQAGRAQHLPESYRKWELNSSKEHVIEGISNAVMLTYLN